MGTDRLFAVEPTAREIAARTRANRAAQAALFDMAPATPAGPCAVCADPDHLTAGCPHGIAAQLLEV